MGYLKVKPEDMISSKTETLETIPIEPDDNVH